MSESITEYKGGLPTKIEDLTRFVLIGREKLVSVRAEIRAIDKLGLAKDVREQKRDEAGFLADALLDAESKIGNLLNKIPKATPNPKDPSKLYSGIITKQQQVKELGFTNIQASQFQQLSDNPDIVEQIKAEAKENDDLPTRTAVLKEIRIRENEDNRGKVAANYREASALGDKKYKVIYADPPWKYDGGKPLSNKYGDVSKFYPQMETEDICKLPVKDMSRKDCVLFLWVTSPKLPQGLQVMEAWGFTYKTSFVWDKMKHNYGFYNSVQHEFLLIGGIGSSTPDNKKLHRSIVAIERTKHSEKPEYFRSLIDKLYEDESEDVNVKIELFNRGELPTNWDGWGNES